MTIHYYKNDLPDGLNLGPVVAVDGEMMGLNPHRDRLCLVQLSSGDGNAHLVHLVDRDFSAPNLKKLLGDKNVVKIFHVARTDLAVMKHWLGVRVAPVFCTKVAARLVRTYTDKNGMKDLITNMLGVEFVKGVQQTSDWGAVELTEDQKTYAADDVLYLHKLREKLIELLKREDRMELAQACFDYLPFRAELDLGGWPEDMLGY